MGKATGIGSQFRGKVGNVIGYLTKNRAGRYEQTVKGYQPVVANPQSYAQALARVPVGPVQRVCSALLPLIQRGWEGTAYGDAAKNEFLSYNLKYFRGPFMPKGTVTVPPGPMLITKGSLRSINVLEFYDGEDWPFVTFDLRWPDNYTRTTIGAWSQTLLQYNSWLVAGEQLTFVWCVLEGGQYIWSYYSVILDVNDTRAFPNAVHFTGFERESVELELWGYEDGSVICAAGVIRSQPYGETSFKRSTMFLECNRSVELYNDDAAVKAAVASYRTGEDAEDWEDDPTPEYQQLAYLCMVDITADMVLSPTTPPISGRQCLGYVTKGGDIGIFYVYNNAASANVLIDEKGYVMYGTGPSGQIPFSYNASYQPARAYSSIYGTM